jgi:hypothetical protein
MSDPSGLFYDESPHHYIANAKKDVELVNSVLVSDKSRINNDIRGQVTSATTSLMSNIGHAAVVISALQAEIAHLKMAILELKGGQDRTCVSSDLLQAECSGDSVLQDTQEFPPLPKQSNNLIQNEKMATHIPTMKQGIKRWSSSNARTKRRNIIQGQGEKDPELKAVERKKIIHAFSFAPETTEDQIKAYMIKKDPKLVLEVEKVITRGNHHASFKISLPESEYDNWMTPERWPLNKRVNQWFFRRKPQATAGIQQE